VAALGFGPIVSTTMAIRATGNSAAGVACRWVADGGTAAPWVVADIKTPHIVLHRAGSGGSVSSKKAPG
jgi:hypothetical protein